MGENKDFNEPIKLKKIGYFVWYVLKSPFVTIIDTIANSGDSLRSLKRPRVWINLWVIGVSFYIIWFWQRLKAIHLLLLLGAFVVIMLWYLWVRGDWVNELREKGKIV